jgi:hypothetical protein
VTQIEPADGAAERHESGSIQYRDAHGDWHEISAEPKRTGDEELDAIWSMSFGDLERILEDESHPLHEKARRVAADIAQPLVDAAREIMRPITESIAESIGVRGIVKTLLPVLDTSWFAKLMPELPRREFPAIISRQFAESASLAAPQLRGPEQRWIDLDSVEPPKASLTEIREAVEVRAHELRSRQIEILSELLMEARVSAESGKEALYVSKQALDATKSSKRAGWIAAWAALGAAVVGMAGIIVTILLSR